MFLLGRVVGQKRRKQKFRINILTLREQQFGAMQRLSAQDITFTNYKEKLHTVIRNCKQQQELGPKQYGQQQQKKNLSRSNSREKNQILAKVVPCNKNKALNQGKPNALYIETSFHDSQSKHSQLKQPISQKARSNSLAGATSFSSQNSCVFSGSQSVQSKSTNSKRPSNQFIAASCKQSNGQGQNNYSIFQPNQCGGANPKELFSKTKLKEKSFSSPKTQIQQLRELLNQRDKSCIGNNLDDLNNKQEQLQDENIETGQNQSDQLIDEQQQFVILDTKESNSYLSSRKYQIIENDSVAEQFKNPSPLNQSNLSNKFQSKAAMSKQGIEGKSDTYSKLRQLKQSENILEISASKINITPQNNKNLQNLKEIQMLCRDMIQPQKVIIPKIKNFDLMVEEKNQQMEYEIPPHVYNLTFEGEEDFSSSCSVSERIGSVTCEEKEQNMALEENPVLGLRSIIKTMELGGKEGDLEVKTLKVTIRKLQYRDAVLRQKIAQMVSSGEEKEKFIRELEQEMGDLKNQLDSKNMTFTNIADELDHLKEERLQENQNIESQFKKYSQKVQELENQNVEFEVLKKQWKAEKLKFEEDIYSHKKQAEEEKKKLENELNKLKEQHQEEMVKQELACLERLAEFQERNLDLEDKYEQIKMQTIKEYECKDKLTYLEQENAQLRDSLMEYKEQKEWLEEALKNYLLSRELEKVKGGKVLEDEDEDQLTDQEEEYKETSQIQEENAFIRKQPIEVISHYHNGLKSQANLGEIKQNNYLPSTQKLDIQKKNTPQNEKNLLNQASPHNSKLIKQDNIDEKKRESYQWNMQAETHQSGQQIRKSHHNLASGDLENTNHNNTNFQISMTEVSCLSLINDQKKKNNISPNNYSQRSSNSQKSDSSNFLKEVDSNAQYASQNIDLSGTNLFNNIHHILNTSCASNTSPIPSFKNNFPSKQNNTFNQIGKENNQEISRIGQINWKKSNGNSNSQKGITLKEGTSQLLSSNDQKSKHK